MHTFTLIGTYFLWVPSKFYSDLRKASGEEELNFFLSALLIAVFLFQLAYES